MTVATALLAIRFALYFDLLLVFGLPLFAMYAFRGMPERPVPQDASRVAVPALALLGAVFSAIGLVALVASMSGVALLAVDRASLDGVVNATAIGSAGKIRIAALLVAAASGLLAAVRLRGSLQAAAGAVAVASLAWTGHGAAGEGTSGAFHLAADIVHLLAAGVWVGALAGLSGLLVRAASPSSERAGRIATAHYALAGFSTIGVLVVGAIVVTGAINTWMLVGAGNLLTLASDGYGRALIVKLLLFAAMVGLAGVNRWRLTPALAMSGGAAAAALRSTRRIVLLETSLAVAVLVVVAWLGTLQPPASS